MHRVEEIGWRRARQVGSAEREYVLIQLVTIDVERDILGGESAVYYVGGMVILIAREIDERHIAFCRAVEILVDALAVAELCAVPRVNENATTSLDAYDRVARISRVGKRPREAVQESVEMARQPDSFLAARERIKAYGCGLEDVLSQIYEAPEGPVLERVRVEADRSPSHRSRVLAAASETMRSALRRGPRRGKRDLPRACGTTGLL